MGPARACLLLLTALLFLLGCSSCLVRAAHPWFEDDDAVFEEDLLGGWVGSGEQGNLAMTAVRGDNGTYIVQYSSKDGRGVFEARLARLGGLSYLDFRPGDEAPGLDGLLFFPTHSVARIELDRDNLTLYLLDYDAVKKAAREGNLRDLKYEWANEKDFLIVSSPGELRSFLVAHVWDTKLFSEPIRLTRKK